MNDLMRLYTYKETSVRLPASRIKQLFESIIEEEAESDWPAHVNLIVSTDTRLRSLNQRHRGIDKPTDVLSFNIDPPEERNGVFGEIYISLQTVVKQAKEYGVTVSEEFLRLICHGLLHLFGYDHMEAKQTRQMEEKQEYYLSRLNAGVGH